MIPNSCIPLPILDDVRVSPLVLVYATGQNLTAPVTKVCDLFVNEFRCIHHLFPPSITAWLHSFRIQIEVVCLHFAVESSCLHSEQPRGGSLVPASTRERLRY